MDFSSQYDQDSCVFLILESQEDKENQIQDNDSNN